MKLSLNWLQSYLEQKADWDVILEKLTMAGIEVENITSIDDDKVVEFKITPNRGDCLSVRGLLREICALSELTINKQFEADLFSTITPQTSDKININVMAKDLCPNYLSLIIKDIDNKAQTPKDILEKLDKSGLRSISPIVDITNYVMLELGQPLHAFDLAKIGGAMQVRLAENHEEIKLLDGKTVNLLSHTLVIANADDKPVAIAGVMGGFDSGVIESTKDIVLESAFFIPKVISGIAKAYGVVSDSAYRYERGVDYKLQHIAINYAARLIKEICGGEINLINQCTTAEYFPQSKQITVEYKLINKVIGEMITPETINVILYKLGFKVINNNSLNDITLEVPSFRFDIVIKEDIIEEIIRVYGYDNIKPVMPTAIYNINIFNKTQFKLNSLKSELVSLGYSEIVGYAFHEESYARILGEYNHSIPNLPIILQNPIAGLSVMRTNLITDLLKSLIHNVNRGHTSVRLFEVARVFHGESKDLQPIKIAGLLYGNYYELGWANKVREVDFFDIKHDVELLLQGRDKIRFEQVFDYPAMHSGRSSKIYYNEEEVGIVGQLHPKIGYELGLVNIPYLFELDVNSLLSFNDCVKIQVISKFPKVCRDLSFIIKDSIAIGLIIKAVKDKDIQYLVESQTFDIYQGANLESGYKSVAINFIFQANKTLTDVEINQNMQIITNLIEDEFQAILRKE